MFANHKLNPVYALNLIWLHCAAISAFFLPFHTAYFGWMIFHYLWFGLASTLYYHRGLTHRAYEMRVPLQLFFLLGGLVGLSGDPIRWAAIHRYHHQHSDRVDDVHSPKSGFLYAYLGWSLRMDEGWLNTVLPLSDDLKQKWFLRWAQGHGLTALVHAVYVLIALKWGGIGFVLWAIYLPLLLAYNFTWMLIASLGHLPQWGSRRYPLSDQSTNLGWLGALSFGEGYHNNHHANPNSARSGVCWYEIDLASYFIWLFEKTHLVTNVDWKVRR